MSRWVLWTSLALGLHALALLSARSFSAPARPPPPAELRLIEANFDLETAERPAPEPSAGQGEGALPEGGGATLVARATRRAPARDAPAPAAGEAEPASPDASAASEEPVAANEGPRLSLDALGIGPANPFLRSDLSRPRRGPNPEQRKESAAERGERLLAGELLRADHARGLGPEGPVLRELENEVRKSEVAANSSALLRVTTDARGKVLSVIVVESTTDPSPWRNVARRALAGLGAKTLRVPRGYGVTFEVRVTSRQTLPSGADPGVDVSVLGVPIQKGDGERSTKIELLNPLPKLSTVDVTTSSGQTVRVPVLTMGTLIAVAGDPADLGAPAQRVVHAHVESLTVTGKAGR